MYFYKNYYLCTLDCLINNNYINMKKVKLILFFSLIAIVSCKQKGELSSFEIMNNKIEESNEINSIKNGTLLDVIYNKAKNDEEFAHYKSTADKVHQISDTFYNYLNDLKMVVKEKKSTKFVDELFFNNNEITSEGEEFLNYIENYKSSLISTVVLTNPDVVGMIKSTFDIGSIEDRKGKQTNWLTLNYQGFPPVATVVKLSKMQSDIKRIETEYYSSILKVKLKQIKGDGSDMIKNKPNVADNSLVDETENDTNNTTKTTVKETTSEVIKEKAPKKEEVVKKTVETNVFHIVQKGETMYQISKKYGIPTTAIKKLNGMTNNNLRVGQKIRIAK